MKLIRKRAHVYNPLVVAFLLTTVFSSVLFLAYHKGNDENECINGPRTGAVFVPSASVIYTDAVREETLGKGVTISNVLFQGGSVTTTNPVFTNLINGTGTGSSKAPVVIEGIGFLNGVVTGLMSSSVILETNIVLTIGGPITNRPITVHVTVTGKTATLHIPLVSASASGQKNYWVISALPALYVPAFTTGFTAVYADGSYFVQSFGSIDPGETSLTYIPVFGPSAMTGSNTQTLYPHTVSLVLSNPLPR